MLSNSTSGDNSLEDSDSGSLCCGSVYSNLQNTMETLLVEVDVSAQAKYQRAQVPIVSLMSKSNKIAIIGHPIEVETLEDVPEVLLVKKDSDDHVVANCGRKMHPLVWKTTYKRTPVCYITNLNSSASSYPGAKKNDVPQTNESLLKPLTKGNFSQNNGHDLRIVRRSSQTSRIALDQWEHKFKETGSSGK